MNIIKIKISRLLLWLGIALGLTLTALLWLNTSTQLYTALRWISYAGITGLGIQRLVHNTRRRAFSLLALFASVSILYLFPALLGPACSGTPKAFASALYGGACGRTCPFGCCIGGGCSVCPEDPPPVPILPPTISGALNCALPGSNGWCRSNAQLALTAADHQGYALTITGSAGSVPISCTESCTIDLPIGFGTATYTVTAAKSGKSASGSTTWYYDPDLPVILISAAGNLAQDGWYSTPVDLSASASDATSGMAGNVSLSFDNGATWVNGPLTLSDGLYDVLFQALDYAGNIATAYRSLKIDTQPPLISLSETGALGRDGWYVSAATVSAAVSDNLSGVAFVQYRVNGGAWQEGAFVTVEEGVYTIDFQVFDAAGNKTQITSQEIHVDTTPPAYLFDAALSDAVLADTVTLGGTASDGTSTVREVQFSSDGTTWTAASFADPRWRFVWDSTVFDNGNHELYLRAEDVAGNLGQPIRLHIILDNFPPYVKLTKNWNIWESGLLTVFNNIIPLKSVKIIVHDPKQRYPDQIIYDDLSAPKTIRWDRVIGPASAPPGSYTVSVEVCDIYKLCAGDTGTILIPSAPTPVPIQPVKPNRKWWSLPIAIRRPTVSAPEQPSVVPAVVLPIQEAIPIVPSFPIWTLVVISALLLSFALLLLLDPRPKAWRSLTRSLHQHIQYFKE